MVANPASSHIRTAGGLHIALGILAILGGIVLIIVIPIVQAALDIAEDEANGEDRGGIDLARSASTTVLLTIGVVMLAVGTVGIVGGTAMINGRPGGRGWGYAASALQLLNIPFGTAVAIYSFVALGMDGADAHFVPQVVVAQ